MIIGMYSIRDRVASEFQVPFYAANDPAAKRSVQTELYQHQSQLTMFADDYVLAKVGSFNTVTGAVVPVDDPQYLCSLQALLPKVVPEAGER